MNPLYPSSPAAHGACPAGPLPCRPGRSAFPRRIPRGLRRTLGVLLVTAGLGVAAAPAHALDVNQASAQQLEGIRGIGPRTAEIIVGERDRGGKFDSFEDLAERVRGIGLKKAQALESAGLQIGAGGPAATAAPSAKPGDKPAARSEPKPGAKAVTKPASGPATLKAKATPRP
ncbi:MAG TPA: helix-hairpin-helix domain-containing protein [Achromobacter sp.]|uniref:ComEA family DNA-binding protein n=1 Tax=unclassified Achromobacter TaxID=2626865 RepID=UPI000CFB3F2C|nr:helix-hairpin-helix domain-containing protein [Achromobacter sp. MYb9]PQZ71609.1 DNA-binding protein [Achromobacter sp. MYb9]